MSVKVTKMQGCGNDFVIVDYDEYKKSSLDMSDFARKICDRHFGIGADGLIIPNINIEGADIGWFFYNSDGSTAQMCGNGMRCFSKYVFDRGFVDKKNFSVMTLAGVVKPQIMEDGNVMVNMGVPILDVDKIPFLPISNMNYKISVKNRIFTGSAVSMGNPHFVIFIDDDEDLLELAKEYGPDIENSVEFPEKTNVEFVKILSQNKLSLRVWERGCGITLACGTGACASVVAGVLNGMIKNNVKVELLGGEVEVVWNGSPNLPNGDVFLCGPADYVFETEFNI